MPENTSKDKERIIDSIKKSKRVRRRLTIRGALSFLIILTLIRAFFMGRYENVFVCILSLILFCVPMILEKRLSKDIKPLMEGII